MKKLLSIFTILLAPQLSWAYPADGLIPTEQESAIPNYIKPEWTVCETDDDCKVAKKPSCCSACAPILGTINKKYYAQFREQFDFNYERDCITETEFGPLATQCTMEYCSPMIPSCVDNKCIQPKSAEHQNPEL